MKIGILTFNRAINYGAVLQALALKQVLQKNTDFVEIINYKCDYIEKTYSFKNDHFFKRILKTILYFKKNKKFKHFISKISSEAEFTKGTIKKCNDIYDIVIVGSDQVWNANCNGHDYTFLLEWFEKKKYSYSASFGLSSIPKNEVAIYKKALSSFDGVSVREETGKRICANQLDINAIVTIDPSLLLDKNEWISLLELKCNSQSYILIYAFLIDENIKTIALKIKNKYKLPIYVINTSIKNKFGDKLFNNSSPKEFVELIYNAKFIVTDSFHGTAFSINFNKEFFVVAKNDRSSRILDLLSLLDLKDRSCDKNTEINQIEKIDYNKISGCLNRNIKLSLNYLKSIVGNYYEK